MNCVDLFITEIKDSFMTDIKNEKIADLLSEKISINNIAKIISNLEINNNVVLFCSPDKTFLPQKKQSNDIGFDISIKNHLIQLSFLKSSLIETNVKTYASDEIYFELLPRSSTWKKAKVILANSIGLIEPSYRGEILANVLSLNENGSLLVSTDEQGNRIDYFQLIPKLKFNHNYKQTIIVKIDSKTIFESFHDIFQSQRGNGGFGSTDEKQSLEFGRG